MKIAVLLGGTSAERDVSFSTGIAIAKALKENGHEVQAIDCAYGDKTCDFENLNTADIIRITPSDIEKEKGCLDRNIFTTIDYLLKEEFAVVFNALHGGYGENGQLPALLELVRIPYTGSGTLASALGMDKHLSKTIFQAIKVPTAPWKKLKSLGEFDARNFQQWELPLVVKPNDQGSTVGLSIVKSRSDFNSAVEKAFQYGETVLVEKYIPGKEIAVSVLGEAALPIIEIIPESGFYDYEAKYHSGRTKYEVPATIPPGLTTEIQQAALRAYNGLGCRGYARIDLRLQENGQFFCLEVNTLPGMTPTSLVPKAAKAVGISFNELVKQIVKLALK
jgi:D-alanine-D-alanine ligase